MNIEYDDDDDVPYFDKKKLDKRINIFKTSFKLDVKAMNLQPLVLRVKVAPAGLAGSLPAEVTSRHIYNIYNFYNIPVPGLQPGHGGVPLAGGHVVQLEAGPAPTQTPALALAKPRHGVSIQSQVTNPLPYLSLFFCQLQTFCYHCMLDGIYEWLPEVGEVPGAGQQLLGPGEVGQEVL